MIYFRTPIRPSLSRTSALSARTRALSNLPRTIRQVLASSTDEPVTVHGWVRSVRRQKRITFAEVNDGSTAKGIQAVISPQLAARLTTGASVKLQGILIDSPGAGQAKEVKVESVQVLGGCDPETYPMQKKDHSPEFLRDHAHLRSRTATTSAVLRVRDSLARHTHDWFKANDFLQVQTPVLTSSDCEGAGEVFLVDRAQSTDPSSDASHSPPSSSNVPLTSAPSASASLSHPSSSSHLSATEPFFSTPTYLTVSSQLHLESFASAIGRVYTLSPTFRAEPSQTSRHLAEFWMLEAETAFVGDLEGVMSIAEASIKAALRGVLDSCPDDLHVLGRDSDLIDRLTSAVSSTWPRMSYSAAIEHLSAQHARTPFTYPPTWGASLQSEHEKWLAGTFVSGPVFITDYPSSQKPFYMRANAPNPSDPSRESVACFDLLVPRLGELAGGSLREERLELLEQRMDSAGLKREDYRWYTDLRRFGGAPHGGYGMGWERFLSWVTGVENVRDVVVFPRWAGRCHF